MIEERRGKGGGETVAHGRGRKVGRDTLGGHVRKGCVAMRRGEGGREALMGRERVNHKHGQTHLLYMADEADRQGGDTTTPTLSSY